MKNNYDDVSSLDEFLEIGNVDEVRKVVPVRASNGKTYKILIRPLTRDEHSSFQKRSTDISIKKAAVDTGKYASLVCEACIVAPNFKDADFLAKAGCHSAGDFLQKKFAAGTIMEISEAVQELSGFSSLSEDVEEAKN